MLEPGFRIWLPGILWHYNLHQTKLFKDFAPKKSNLTYVQKLLQNNLKSTSKLPQLPPKLSQNFWNRFNPSPPLPALCPKQPHKYLKTTPKIPQNYPLFLICSAIPLKILFNRKPKYDKTKLPHPFWKMSESKQHFFRMVIFQMWP